MKHYIPDCYWPDSANGSYVSHEAICILNTTKNDATIKLTLYFEDRDKMEGFSVVVPSERTKHIRLDKLLSDQNQPIPKATPYAILVDSDVDVAVQYSRLDTTQAELALATTIV